MSSQPIHNSHQTTGFCRNPQARCVQSTTLLFVAGLASMVAIGIFALTNADGASYLDLSLGSAIALATVGGVPLMACLALRVTVFVKQYQYFDGHVSLDGDQVENTLLCCGIFDLSNYIGEESNA